MPCQETGMRSTATSAAEGRLKPSMGTKRRRNKKLRHMVKDHVSKKNY